MKLNRETLLSALLALLAAWRLPPALGLPVGDAAFASHAISAVLAVALYCLFRRALGGCEKRLTRLSAALGLLFAAVTLVGEDIRDDGRFAPFAWPTLLNGLLTLCLLALVFGAAIALCLRAAGALAGRGSGGAESRFSRLLGNPLIVFALLLACWVPAWLAYWPGVITGDPITQLSMCLDESYSTHHPLLHTLLLGFLVKLGMEIDPEGSMALGLTIYGAAQMALMAAMLAYACRWLYKRGAPVWARVCVTLLFALFPFYALWSFNVQKDVLFGGLVLLTVLQLADLWRDGYKLLRSPWRIVCFVLTTLLMTLMRNNGVYALCLLLPFAALWAKGARIRVTALLAGCVALYFAASGALAWALDAESGSRVEMLSIPLQQLARVLRDDPQSVTQSDRGLIDEFYWEDDPAALYDPAIADPVKWAIDYDLIDERPGDILAVWARLGASHPTEYAEAFLQQNLPYLLPGAEMVDRFDLRLIPLDLYPIEPDSKLPKLRETYDEYDRTLAFLGLPGVRLTSDTAAQVWLCALGLGFAVWRRDRRYYAAFGFLLAVWCTCLLGPAALMRYMLGFFYAVPVLLAAQLTPKPKSESPERM